VHLFWIARSIVIHKPTDQHHVLIAWVHHSGIIVDHSASTMDRKKKHVEKRVVIPKSHPPAWGSALWQHVDTIRSMRRARKKWREIAEYLTEQKRVPISPSAVRNFFARATDPDRSRPLGFEPIPLQTDDPDPLPKSSQPVDLPPSPHSKHVLTQPKNEKQKIWS
jgi:hypothetical protein